MKKVLTVIAILVLFFGAGLFAIRKSRELLSSEVGQNPLSTPTGSPIIASAPNRLSIPKIGVDTLVEFVGEDYTGRMDVPKDYNNVGWWNQGARPGNRGKAVMAGHVDTPTGEPGVFYRLDELTTGDEITITDKEGKIFVFEVTAKQVFEDKNFPLRDVFGESQVPLLNLITCSGVFDLQEQNYSERLVIFSKLKES